MGKFRRLVGRVYDKRQENKEEEKAEKRAKRSSRADRARIRRAITTAYINAKAKVPKDTGTLRESLQLRQTVNGYTMFFRTTDLNPKSKKHVKEYIDYVERYHTEWWENTMHTFFSELSNQLNEPVTKKR